MRPVIVTTKHRAVVMGYADDTSGTTIHLKDAKWAIYWGTTRGIHELAHDGPNEKSRISLPADLELRDVTAVIEVSEAAEAKWREA